MGQDKTGFLFNPLGTYKPRFNLEDLITQCKLNSQVAMISGDGIDNKFVLVLPRIEFKNRTYGVALALPDSNGDIRMNIVDEHEPSKFVPLVVRKNHLNIDRPVNFFDQLDLLWSFSKIKELADLARISNIVTNELLSLEQAHYYMQWKDRLNPDDQESYKVLYPCMGADLATVLLATNASHIVGVDMSNPDGDQSMNDSDINKMLKYRHMAGYYHISDIEDAGIKRLLAEELQRMGATQVRDDGLNYTFLWAYPGQKPRLRTLTYNFNTRVEDFLNQNHRELYDCYYQKAGVSHQAKLKEFFPRIRDLIKLNGHLVWGATVEGENPDLDNIVGIKLHQSPLIYIDEGKLDRYSHDANARYDRYGFDLQGYKFSC